MNRLVTVIVVVMTVVLALANVASAGWKQNAGLDFTIKILENIHATMVYKSRDLTKVCMGEGQAVGGHGVIQRLYPGSDFRCINRSGTILDGGYGYEYLQGKPLKFNRLLNDGVVWNVDYASYPLITVKTTQGENCIIYTIDGKNKDAFKKLHFITVNLPLNNVNQSDQEKLPQILGKVYYAMIDSYLDAEGSPVTVQNFVNGLLTNQSYRDDLVQNGIPAVASISD